eukprot:5600674-Prymnesium_polylepis.1
MRKRSYGCRAFYGRVLHGVEGARDKNPAWNDMGTNTLNGAAARHEGAARRREGAVPMALKKELTT